MLRHPVAVVVSLFAVSLTGCGQLSDEQRFALSSKLARAEHRLDMYCITGEGNPDRQVDVLVDAFRDHPDFEEDGVGMRDRLRDRASRLDGCAPGLARRLDRELAP